MEHHGLRDKAQLEIVSDRVESRPSLQRELQLTRDTEVETIIPPAQQPDIGHSAHDGTVTGMNRLLPRRDRDTPTRADEHVKVTVQLVMTFPIRGILGKRRADAQLVIAHLPHLSTAPTSMPASSADPRSKVYRSVSPNRSQW